MQNGPRLPIGEPLMDVHEVIDPNDRPTAAGRHFGAPSDQKPTSDTTFTQAEFDRLGRMNGRAWRRANRHRIQEESK